MTEDSRDDTEEPVLLEMPFFVGGNPGTTADALALQAHQIAEHELFRYAVVHALRPDISLDTIRFVAAGLGVRGGHRGVPLELPPCPVWLHPGGGLPPFAASPRVERAAEAARPIAVDEEALTQEHPHSCETDTVCHAAAFVRLALGVPYTPPVVQEFLAGGRTFPNIAPLSPWKNEESAPSSPESWISITPSEGSRELLMKERGKAPREQEHGKLGIVGTRRAAHNGGLAPTWKQRALRLVLVVCFSALGFWLLKHGFLSR